MTTSAGKINIRGAGGEQAPNRMTWPPNQVSRALMKKRKSVMGIDGENKTLMVIDGERSWVLDPSQPHPPLRT